ncbi:MAG: hypothetical protein IKD89_06640 [Clostridia bacterium]|nr:hypothetical protein [Clostridia bacterium]
MKRIISIVLAIIIAVTLCSCGTNGTSKSSNIDINDMEELFSEKLQQGQQDGEYVIPDDSSWRAALIKTDNNQKVSSIDILSFADTEALKDIDKMTDYITQFNKVEGFDLANPDFDLRVYYTVMLFNETVNLLKLLNEDSLSEEELLATAHLLYIKGNITLNNWDITYSESTAQSGATMVNIVAEYK